jgi:hypothetical protein
MPGSFKKLCRRANGLPGAPGGKDFFGYFLGHKKVTIRVILDSRLRGNDTQNA